MQVLLDYDARLALQHFLRGFHRPEKVTPATWAALIDARLVSIQAHELGALCDAFSSKVLDVIRFPVTRAVLA